MNQEIMKALDYAESECTKAVEDVGFANYQERIDDAISRVQIAIESVRDTITDQALRKFEKDR